MIAEPYATFSLVRVPFPFTDRTMTKRRPALVVSAPHVQTNSDRRGVAECLRQLLPLQ